MIRTLKKYFNVKISNSSIRKQKKRYEKKLLKEFSVTLYMNYRERGV